MLCTKCDLEKDVYLFRNPNKQICIDCELEKVTSKMEKFQSNNIGLENLDTSLNEILVVSKCTIFTYFVPLEKAIELVKSNKAHVYKPDMIYKFNQYKDISWVIRYIVFKRDNFICHYCGNFGDTIDHINPKSKDGETTEENLVCCCKECNTEKSDMSYEEYLEYIKLPKWQRRRKVSDDQIQIRRAKAKKQNRTPNVLLKQREKYGWD